MHYIEVISLELYHTTAHNASKINTFHGFYFCIFEIFFLYNAK
nr:MAG TPA: hypothetical protein [Caudoviricetes sp.]